MARHDDQPIHKAAERGDVAEVQRLLAEDPTLVTAPGWSGLPLYSAASSGSMACVDALLAAGADVNAVTDGGASAIFSSATGEIAARLIEAGARVDLVSALGRVALDYACQGLRVDVVRVLLAHGADPKYAKPVNKFRTMMQWAIEEVSSESDAQQIEAAEQIVRMLLGAGAEVNEIDAFDMTALHKACHRGLTGIVKLLLEHGADPQLRSVNKETAFGAATKYPEIVALLEPYGPEIPAPPKPPQTPQQLVDRLIACGEMEADDMEPCSAEDIAWLESKHNVILPESYKLFLRMMGRGAGDFLVDDHFQCFLETFEWEEKIIAHRKRRLGGNIDAERLPEGLELPENHFVFAERNGYFWMYFIADGTDDDPPIYSYMEDAESHMKKFDSFWGFIEEMVEYYEFYRDQNRFSRNDS